MEKYTHDSITKKLIVLGQSHGVIPMPPGTKSPNQLKPELPATVKPEKDDS